MRPVDAKRFVAAAALIALSACSQELYGEAQDPVTFQLGDAVASNRAAMMIDPWAAHSADTRLSFKGKPMNSAINRYYSGTVLPPVATSTSSSLNGASQSASAGAASSSGATTSN